ncbi:MAG: PH domain-containing protein, partial [Sphingomicrobium sp.]
MNASEIAPDSTPDSVLDGTLGPAERLHPLFLLTGLGGVVRGAWGVLAAGAWAATQGRWWIVGVMLAAFGMISVGGLLLKWLKLEYRVGADEIRIDSGFLSRTSRAIPFDRVRDVDIEQGPLQRLFGLAKVRFETGASAGAKNEDGVLHTIALERAEAIRHQIRARHGGAITAGGEAAGEEESAPIFAMDSRRVLSAGLFNFSLVLLAGLFGLTQTLGNVAGFDPFSRHFWSNALDLTAPVQALVIGHQIIAAIAGTLVLAVVGVATGIVRIVLRDHGFRLDRAAAGLRRRRGLLTLTDVTLPLKRVQAAIIATGPVRR